LDFLNPRLCSGERSFTVQEIFVAGIPVSAVESEGQGAPQVHKEQEPEKRPGAIKVERTLTNSMKYFALDLLIKRFILPKKAEMLHYHSVSVAKSFAILLIAVFLSCRVNA
jgi:hypothetical protein